MGGEAILVPPVKLGGSFSGPRARIMVATPSYSGELHVRYVESYVASLVYCLSKRVEIELRIVAGASLIQYARNQLIREFLEDETFTHMMWIDADVGFDPRAIIKLLDHGKDVIGGVYPMKCMPVEWPYEPMRGEQVAGLHRAKVLPGGFMLCSRKAIQAVADAAPKYWHYMQGLRFRTAHVMDLTLENETLLGEDVILCRKFIQAGFDVFVEPDLAFSHTGKFEWRGVLKKAIEQGHGQGSVDAHLLQDLRNETDPMKMGDILGQMFAQWDNKWAAPPTELAALCILARKHKMILETGSGLSTIAMAAANPDAKIHVLESDPEWCKKLHAELTVHGLDNVTIHLSPLDGENYFYQIPEDLPKSFDMVFHDGPVWLDGTKMSKCTDTRLPFYTLLADRVKDAVLIIDDIEQYQDIANNYRHEVVCGRFAICLPNSRKAEAA